MTMSAGKLNVGDTMEQVVVEGLTRTQMVMYAGASCDFNPLHSDEVYATQAAGFPAVFGQGMLTMAMTGKAVTDHVGDARLRRFGGRFRGQVWPGDTLTVRLSVEAIRWEDGEPLVELAVVTVNHDSAVVFAGTAEARIDP